VDPQNLQAHVIINAIAGAEIVHKGVARHVLVLRGHGLHQLVDLADVAALGRRHAVADTAPAVGVGQTRLAQQVHDMVGRLDRGNGPVQKGLHERGGTPLRLLY